MSVEYHEEDVPHVLAVDDNIIDRTLVEKLLKTSSCRVRVFRKFLDLFWFQVCY
ncbi:hypothetical protein HanRHA438_Chr07g0322771 [Helianthus annuus]|nr:hypothetical protein HanRHA438_Chr07g0322771 [Helianthus annuus]